VGEHVALVHESEHLLAVAGAACTRRRTSHSARHRTASTASLASPLQRRSLLRDAADAGIDAAAVLAHDLRSRCGFRSLSLSGVSTWIRFTGRRLMLLIESERVLKQDATSKMTGLDVGNGHGAQEHSQAFLRAKVANSPR